MPIPVRPRSGILNITQDLSVFVRKDSPGEFVLSPFTIRGTTPTLIFEDTTGGDDDLQIVVNADGMLIEIVGGQDILTLSAAGVTALAPFTVDGTTDTLIKANGYIVGYPRILEINHTNTGNVTTGLDDLHTFSLPGGSLATNKDLVEFEYGGVFAGTNNNKRIVVSINSNTAFDSGARDIDQAFGWWISGKYIRVSDTTVRATGTAVLGRALAGTDGAYDAGNSRWYLESFPAATTLVTVSDLDINANTMKVQAEGTATDDIIQTSSVIKVTQFT